MLFQRQLIKTVLCAFFLGILLSTDVLAENWSKERTMMVERDLRSRNIHNKNVLAVMEKVERHLFVPWTVRSFAYTDRPLPIGEGQTISQPYIVALMSQLLEIKKGMKVLEVGTGSGYQAAVIQAMGAEIYSIEIIKKLATDTQKLFKDMKLPIQVKNADGYYGWEEASPFDRIIITAAANHVPRPLLNQLKPGGKLILPLGNIRFYQTLTLVTMDKHGKTSVEHHGNVRFVPMTGKMLN